MELDCINESDSMIEIDIIADPTGLAVQQRELRS